MFESPVQSSLLPFFGKTGTKTSPSKSKTLKRPDRTGPCRSFVVLSSPRLVLGPVLGIYFLYTTNKIQLYLLKFKKDAHALEMQDGGAGKAGNNPHRVETQDGGA